MEHNRAKFFSSMPKDKDSKSREILDGLDLNVIPADPVEDELIINAIFFVLYNSDDLEEKKNLIKDVGLTWLITYIVYYGIEYAHLNDNISESGKTKRYLIRFKKPINDLEERVNQILNTKGLCDKLIFAEEYYSDRLVCCVDKIFDMDNFDELRDALCDIDANTVVCKTRDIELFIDHIILALNCLLVNHADDNIAIEARRHLKEANLLKEFVDIMNTKDIGEAFMYSVYLADVSCSGDTHLSDCIVLNILACTKGYCIPQPIASMSVKIENNTAYILFGSYKDMNRLSFTKKEWDFSLSSATRKNLEAIIDNIEAMMTKNWDHIKDDIVDFVNNQYGIDEEDYECDYDRYYPEEFDEDDDDTEEQDTSTLKDDELNVIVDLKEDEMTGTRLFDSKFDEAREKGLDIHDSLKYAVDECKRITGQL
jgi:hypothetical protein